MIIADNCEERKEESIQTIDIYTHTHVGRKRSGLYID